MTEMSDNSRDRRDWARLLKRVGAALAVLAMLGWVLWGAWHDARQIEWSSLPLQPGLIVAACVLLIAAFFWHALVWVLMMRALGYPLGVRPGLRAAALSQLGNYIPGKIFIVLLRVQVVAPYGVPGIPVAGSVALETLLRNLMATILAGLGLWHLGAGLSTVTGLVMLAAVSVVFAHPRVFHAIGDWVLRKTGRPPLPRRLSGPQVLGLLGCYLLYWALYVAGFYLVIEGTLGVDVAAWPALATAVFAGQIGSTLAVFAPVGLGAVEASMAGVLALTGAVSAPYMVALVGRVWRTVSEMAQIGMVMLIPLPPPRDHERKESSMTAPAAEGPLDSAGGQ